MRAGKVTAGQTYLMAFDARTGDERWRREALRWRNHFLDHSPDYLAQQPATFHVTSYLVRRWPSGQVLAEHPLNECGPCVWRDAQRVRIVRLWRSEPLL